MKSNIKKLMNKKNMTLRKLMAATGLANKTILKARSDQMIETCTLKTLKIIAYYLECEIKDLFDE